jgi:hypothetical protein
LTKTGALLVYEEKSTYIDHDRLFKELIKEFFEEFVEAFYPAIHSKINFHSVKFLEQEVFTDIVKGDKRYIDILAETTIKGESKVILIHVEPQSTFQKDFHERMFIYYSRLYEKFRKPIVPIAVLSYETKRKIPDHFSIEAAGFQPIIFNYLPLHLITLDWKKFIEQDNPAAAALLSKMGYKEEERVKVKLEFLRMVARMELNPAKMELLYGFFETYLKLTKEEEQKMNKEVSKLPKEEADRVMELPNSYREKGREEGITLTKKQMISNMLEQGLPDKLIAKIAEIDLDELEEIKKEL